jgi:hypothetical protein
VKNGRVLTDGVLFHMLYAVRYCYAQDWQSASGSVAAAAAGDVWCTSQQFLDVLAGKEQCNCHLCNCHLCNC